MAPKYSKHAILEGIVDYFCLVCETHFISENERDIHVGQKDHINKLSATHYVHEFKEDGIRKINKIYFCEFCNKLIPSLVKIRLHITELTHVDKRNFYAFERIENFVIAFKEIVIDEQSWHSFYDKSCAICNIEYDDEETHKAEATHILNLILVKVEFDKDKNLYRKIDNESCHCITCNILVASNTINSHFNEIEHKNKIESCKDAINKIKSANIEENNNINDEQKSENVRGLDNKDHINVTAPTENTPSPKYSDSTDLLENISKFQNNGININFELNIAFCKKCNLDIDMKVDAIENHIDEHNKKPLKKEKDIDIKSGHDKVVTNKKHSLYTSPVRLKKNVEKSVDIDNLNVKVNSVDNIDEHNKTPLKKAKTLKAKNKKVESKKAHIVHPIDNAKESDENDISKENITEDVNKQNFPQKKVLKKVWAHSFVTSMVAAKSDVFQDFVINNKFCINCMSFFLITPNMECLTCKVRVDDIAEHVDNPNHNSIIHNTVSVITEFDSEFIREISKDVYHCGYCNITKSWDEMEIHLKMVSHIENKNSSFWRLQMYLSDMGGKTPPFISMEQFVKSSRCKN